jgi:hypothetical protein
MGIDFNEKDFLFFPPEEATMSCSRTLKINPKAARLFDCNLNSKI